MKITALTNLSELEAILPLVAGYRTFYELPPDGQAARTYLARFLEPSDDGVLFAAGTGGDDPPVGYACLHWQRSSFALRDTAYLSDLYVAAHARGAGAGRALLEACAQAARARGLDTLEWLTGVENRAAQRLYDKLGAEREACFEYTLPLHDRPLTS